MHPFLSGIGNLATLRFRSRASLELEVIALRHQLGVLRRKGPKKFHVPIADRLFWIWLYRLWPGILDSMVLVKPRTVIAWHYAGFRALWRWKSKRTGDHSRKVWPETRALIYQMKRDNPMWGARRISAELKMLGIDIERTTVKRYLTILTWSPTPGWTPFVKNHMHQTAAMDFLVVVTLSFQLLYASIIVSHGRRKIIHVDVTRRPTQDWAVGQVQAAFAGKKWRPKYLVRDRDSIYGMKFSQELDRLRIKQKVTAKQSPWQNVYVERVIWSIRRECLDHVIVVNERHLKQLLSEYVDYYNNSRTHTALSGDCPIHRAIQRSSKGRTIVANPQVGGLHHPYERRAA